MNQITRERKLLPLLSFSHPSSRPRVNIWRRQLLTGAQWNVKKSPVVGNLITDFRKIKGWSPLNLFIFKHDYTFGIWDLICEIIGWIMFSEDHSLPPERGKPLSHPAENTKNTQEKLRGGLNSLSAGALGFSPAGSTLSSERPLLDSGSTAPAQASPTKTMTSLNFSGQKAAPILTSTHLWVSSAFATETPRWSFSIFVLSFQVSQNSVSSLKMTPWLLFLKNSLLSSEVSHWIPVTFNCREYINGFG